MATIVGLEARLAALSGGYGWLNSALLSAERTDPAFLAWHGRCWQIGDGWLEVQMNTGGGSEERRAVLRDRAVRGDAAEVAAQLDDEIGAAGRR